MNGTCCRCAGTNRVNELDQNTNRICKALRSAQSTSTACSLHPLLIGICTIHEVLHFFCVIIFCGARVEQHPHSPRVSSGPSYPHDHRRHRHLEGSPCLHLACLYHHLQFLCCHCGGSRSSKRSGSHCLGSPKSSDDSAHFKQ